MGQLLLPLFPRDSRMITLTLGIREENGTIYYLHSGVADIFARIQRYEDVSLHKILVDCHALWLFLRIL
jgi:hypothetical protein